ncbi:uncharacterized protein LOC111941131 [Cyanistes caeruleus]|uniref:uncharacterized protein LOC111941131 n=1 Tax=Cyanistes caeruleus TaxID=156563 RepID=UPI000CDB8C16|nr:uncharacterized protein LOC111941131 [Cyanistes caeruleus]
MGNGFWCQGRGHRCLVRRALGRLEQPGLSCSPHGGPGLFCQERFRVPGLFCPSGEVQSSRAVLSIRRGSEFQGCSVHQERFRVPGLFCPSGEVQSSRAVPSGEFQSPLSPCYSHPAGLSSAGSPAPDHELPATPLPLPPESTAGFWDSPWDTAEAPAPSPPLAWPVPSPAVPLQPLPGKAKRDSEPWAGWICSRRRRAGSFPATSQSAELSLRYINHLQHARNQTSASISFPLSKPLWGTSKHSKQGLETNGFALPRLSPSALPSKRLLHPCTWTCTLSHPRSLTPAPLFSWSSGVSITLV